MYDIRLLQSILSKLFLEEFVFIKYYIDVIKIWLDNIIIK